MRTSNQCLAFGVGVFVVCGQALPGVSQPIQEFLVSSETVQPVGSKESDAKPNLEAQSKAELSTTTNRKDAAEAVAESSHSTAKLPLADEVKSAGIPALNWTVKLQPKLNAAAKLPLAEEVKPASVPDLKWTVKLQPRLNAAQAAILKSSQASARSLQQQKPISLTDFKSQQTKLAQATPDVPSPEVSPTGTPTPGTTIEPLTPGNFLPGGSGLVQSPPIGPAKAGAAPDYLNPSPNPLYLPTRPEDVRPRGIQPITLQQALELARRNNRELQIAIEQLERSRAALREVEAALYPTVTAEGTLTQSQSAAGEISEELSRQSSQAAFEAQQELAQAQGLATPTRTQNFSGNSDRANLALSGTVALRYDVYTAGLRPARIRAAEQQVRSDQLQVEVNEQQLFLDVANSYYNLQETDEAVRIQQSAVRNAEASLRDTQALERAGLGTRFDVLRAQVQLANATQNLTNARANQQVRRAELAQILAVPPPVDLAAADPVDVAGRWNLTLPQTVVLALKNRAELEQFLAQRELAEQQRKAALAALGPTVSLQVQYNVLNNLRDSAGFGDGYTVAAGANWTVFDGGAARARANQQEANIRIAETRFAQTRENIRLQVETAFTNLQSSLLNITTSRQAVEQAREALRLARLRFQAGVGTQTDVINAENDLTQAEGNLITAVLGYNRALASLQRSVTNLPIPTRATPSSVPAPATPSTPTPSIQ